MTRIAREEPHAVPLIGRERELSLLDSAVAASPLVTLVGPAGVGKSRLARTWAAWRAERFPGSAWLVDLASLPAGSTLVAIAEALRVRLGPAAGTPAGLAAALAARSASLVLLDGADAATGDIVRACLAEAPDVRLVVTARTRLGLPAERVVEIAPLAADDGARLLRAFAEARGLTPPTPELAVALARRLDGVPLALEIAAARLASTDAESLLAALQSGLGALGPDARLDAALALSWKALPDSERQALARVAVFHGSFGLDAAAAVLDERDAAASLHALREKSLVERESTRFHVLAIVREFVTRLEPAAVVAADTRRREWLSAEAPRWAAACDGPGGSAARERLAEARSDIVAAHTSALRAGDAAMALRLALALEPLYTARGLFDALAGLLEAGAAKGGAPAILLADAWRAIGQARKAAGRGADAKDALTRARQLSGEAQDAQDARVQGRIARAEGLLALEQGNLDDAARHFGAARRHFVRGGDAGGEGRAATDALFAGHQRGTPQRVADYETLLARAREASDRWLEGFVLANLATHHQEEGRPIDAAERHREALAAFRETGDRRFEGITLGNLGIVHQDAGRFAEARASFDLALEAVEEVGARQLRGMVRGYRALLAFEEGWLAEAADGLSAALPDLSASGAARQEAVFLAVSGAVEAAFGRTAGASAKKEAAAARLLSAPDPGARAASALWALPGSNREAALAPLAAGRAARSDDVRAAARVVGAWFADPERMARRRRLAEAERSILAGETGASAARVEEESLAAGDAPAAALARVLVIASGTLDTPETLEAMAADSSLGPAQAAARVLLGEPPPRDGVARALATLARPWRVELVGAGPAHWGFDATRTRAWCGSREVDLSGKALFVAILEAIAQRDGRATKEELVLAVWKEDEYHPLRHDNRLQTAVKKLRKLLEDDADRPTRLLTTSDGYALAGARRVLRT